MDGVVSGGWKLIHNLDPEASRARWELFDSTTDPQETVNLAEKHPDVVRRLAAILDAARSAPAGSAKSTGALDEETRERLRALGYGEQ